MRPSVGSGKCEGVSEAPAPPRRDRDFGDRRAVVRVHHQIGRGRDGGVLGRIVGAVAKQQNVAGLERVRIIARHR